MKRRIKAFLAEHSRKGAKCAECSCTFVTNKGDGKVLATLSNGTGGYSLYVLCRSCGREYKRRGPAAIPNTCRDMRIAVLISDFAPKGKAQV